MSQRPRRIALLGNFGSDNLGNEASLSALLNLARRASPDAQITCICREPHKAREKHGIETAPLRLQTPPGMLFRRLNRLLLGLPIAMADLVRALREVRRHDVILVPGTGMLDDFGEHWRAMPYDIFKWSLAARLMRRPFAFVSIGAGPVAGSISKRLFTWAARLAAYRSYRDLDSRTFMESLSAKFHDDPVYCDLAFLLPSPEKPQSGNPDQTTLTIGVGVMSYHGWHAAEGDADAIYESYVAKLTRFVVWLLGRGYRVRLLVGAAADTRVVDDVVRRVSDQRGRLPASRLIAEPASSLQHLMEQMVGTDAIVSTRFHNIVAAIMVGLPAISIGYAAKNDALLAKAGLGEFCQRIDTLDVELLMRQLEMMVAERGRLTDAVVEARDELRKCADAQATYVVSRFLQAQ